MAEDEVDSAPLERDSLVREALVASVGILLFLTMIKHMGALIPIVGRHAFTIAAAVQLYVPVYLIGRREITRASLGLTSQTWRRDLGIVALLSLATIVPFAIGHHYWQTIVMERVVWWRFPPDFLLASLNNLLVVALPEELFFRGYLQERLERIWTPSKKLFGTPFGLAIVVASAVFALAHFVGEYRPDRLGPFFPALLFGLLRTRTHSIVAPVTYHAFCNILSDLLFALYRSPNAG